MEELPCGMWSITEEDAAKFWSFVKKGDGCWEWQGSFASKGYGELKTPRLRKLAHRISFAIATGIMDDEVCVLHRCDNPKCVNPDHLFGGTRGDNNRDRAAKGRTACGDRHGSKTHPEAVLRGDLHPLRRDKSRAAKGLSHGSKTHPESVPRGVDHANSKLEPCKVLEIRRLRMSGVPVREIASAFGLSRGGIYDVVNGKVWRHVQ